jgi:two-component sensor histidine kinase
MHGGEMHGGETSPGWLADAFLGRQQILITPELARRARRPPNLLAEANAHRELAALVGRDPRAALQRVAELAIVLCRAGSAGVSVLATDDANEPVFQWAAVAGEYSRYRGQIMPRYFSLCGLCFQSSGTILVDRPARAFSDFEGAHVPIVEALFVPLHDAERRPIGVIWAVSHEPSSHFEFDADDARMMEQLALYAALALRLARDERESCRLRDENGQLLRNAASQAQIVDELKHRIKNTLSLVQAIGNLSLKSGLSTAAARQLFNERISALATAHDILTGGSSTLAPISQVVEAAIKMHGQDNKRFRVSGPDLIISPTAATTLSLALHELGTNAVKYGALSNGRGSVNISWSVELRDKPLFEFRWVERGGPPVVAPERRGFGTTVIQNYPRQNCDASTELRFNRSGLQYILVAPLAQIECGSPPIAPVV